VCESTIEENGPSRCRSIGGGWERSDPHFYSKHGLSFHATQHILFRSWCGAGAIQMAFERLWGPCGGQWIPIFRGILAMCPAQAVKQTPHSQESSTDLEKMWDATIRNEGCHTFDVNYCIEAVQFAKTLSIEADRR
jgi:hypothetical protein